MPSSTATTSARPPALLEGLELERRLEALLGGRRHGRCRRHRPADEARGGVVAMLARARIGARTTSLLAASHRRRSGSAWKSPRQGAHHRRRRETQGQDGAGQAGRRPERTSSVTRRSATRTDVSGSSAGSTTWSTSRVTGCRLRRSSRRSSRRLLRHIAEGRALGDVTTLCDPAVMADLEAKVPAEYETKQ
jgi:putative NIF3 family GTP cyclohydrolase 1 type 2